MRALGPWLAALVLVGSLMAPLSVYGQGSGERESPAAAGPTGRQDLESMDREGLVEAGFVFEDTREDQSRARATLVAFFAGPVVHGIGHWQMRDQRTALTLLVAEGIGLSLLGAGLFLGVRGTGNPAIDDLRREMYFLGTGLLAASWMIDVFGTAYRDDLGIPPSTARLQGLGVGLYYDYWRPTSLSMRHVAAAELALRGRTLQAEGRTGQELGYGMSDYEITGRWRPVRGVAPETHLGVEVVGRYLQYRLDDPYESLDGRMSLVTGLNLGRVFPHLDQMTIGVALGLGLRGYRLPDSLGEWSGLRYAGWHVPMRGFLALNLTPLLRFQASLERGYATWLQLRRAQVAVPALRLKYRSTENLDLVFSARFGNGFSLGLGLQVFINP